MATEQMEQQKLVRDCLKGKPQAQRQLYEMYAETMLGVCYRYTRSMRDAEDVLQEAFVKVFHHLDQYKQEGELGAWIRRIMVNTALNFLKRHRKYQEEMYFTEEYLHPVSQDDPVVRIQAKELADLIRQLPQGYQVIFNLHAVEGFSHVEIGEMLGISDGTSRSQYARARNLLITWLKKHSSDQKKTSYAGK
ncbi:RNA polymerase sigma factor [Terrimonas sp. NA20]|jgi:RNA polymerase sigma-70 factor (ECF subfamily)|uniref:RNA polymerase sigma factor n=1 Tax=Terrimonas ginsenosidimutans TaxID=2908004 RepID=A0ABS9L0X8_9BACT|nr:RNA polymerase sigma factor [Terrimonas ginsenosidimutans]MCG2618215.1 RNA polymerase sigma factor [Terrimonas ginsenosidimutans]